MALQPAICSSCGGNIKVDDIDLNGISRCEFCKTPHKVIDVITIDGLPSARSLLETAEHSYQDGNYEKAVEIYNEVLKIKPNCHEAWWGLYKCNSYFDSYYDYKDKYGNKGPLTKAKIIDETLQKYALRAIDYAPKEIADEYTSVISESVKFVESVNKGNFAKGKNSRSGCLLGVFGVFWN